MSSHPPTSDPKSTTVPIRMDPITEDTLSDDDLEPTQESRKERLFGLLKWLLFVGGVGAALYFGGSALRGYWVSDLEQKLIEKNQELELLKHAEPKGSGTVVFDVSIKQVTSSPRGKAYLAIDSMGQPWFVISGLEFKVGDKVLLELKIESQSKSAQVSFRKSKKAQSPESKEVAHDSQSADHGKAHEDSSHSHEEHKTAHP